MYAKPCLAIFSITHCCMNCRTCNHLSVLMNLYSLKKHMLASLHNGLIISEHFVGNHIYIILAPWLRVQTNEHLFLCCCSIKLLFLMMSYLFLSTVFPFRLMQANLYKLKPISLITIQKKVDCIALSTPKFTAPLSFAIFFPMLKKQNLHQEKAWN